MGPFAEERQNLFTPSEFACGCGCQTSGMALEFMERLFRARQEAGIPFVVTSGRRCPGHNAAVGGAPGSAHLTGHAADIACRTSAARHAILRALFLAGFPRIGIGAGFIHAQCRPGDEPGLAWLYPESGRKTPRNPGVCLTGGTGR
ncbi:MAG: D-Ala-D-Ala carboxypeptidase family metallohydrolase [Desulfatibacillaceae bacterium]